MKAARSFHWRNAHRRRTARLQQREIDADRLWRVTIRHWAHVRRNEVLRYVPWFAQEAQCPPA